MYEPHITFSGRLTADSRLTYTQAGKARLQFTVAVNPRRRTHQGEWVDCQAIFLQCATFNRAEEFAETLLKGQIVNVLGTLSAYDGSDGRQLLSVNCDTIGLVPAKGANLTNVNSFAVPPAPPQDEPPAPAPPQPGQTWEEAPF